MLKIENEERVLGILSYLPSDVSEEILRLVRSRQGGIGELREIGLRAGGRCSILYGNERIPLFTTVTRSETDAIVSLLCEGALYAHRDTLASGYVTVRGGIRVGICGYAKYEDGRLAGVSDLRSLLFRIPGRECAFSEELCRAFDGCTRGMLIYSPPGMGKTTAIRSLAYSLGTGAGARRVCVVDERCELCEEDYSSAEVDILKGYSRRAGIEIATRTMSPDVIMIDEIGADDAVAIKDVIRCGIPIVATAHARDYDEIRTKPGISDLIASAAFDTFVGISCDNGRYFLTVNKSEPIS